MPDHDLLPIQGSEEGREVSKSVLYSHRPKNRQTHIAVRGRYRSCWNKQKRREGGVEKSRNKAELEVKERPCIAAQSAYGLS
jgi:hypothetical protein